ncbi:MAG: 30S ribosomal protein S1 [Bacteroidetes bacterium]|nr:30S ribosomal protein S1 [Bacteroidota bacterium]
MADDQQKDAQENEEIVGNIDVSESPEAVATESLSDAPVEATAETKVESVVEEPVVEEAAPSAEVESTPEVEESAEVLAEMPAELEVAETEPEVISDDSNMDVVGDDVDESDTVVNAEASEDDGDEDADDEEEEVAEFEKQLPSPPRSGMLGFTGEITGQVYKLEDLDKVIDPEDWNVGLDDLRKLVEKTLTNVSEHEIVSGKVVSVGEKDVVIDIGFKSDGIVSRSEFGADLEAGQEVEVYLERIEDYHGQLVLSKTKADTVRRWRRIEDAFNNEEVLEGLIVRRIKGGMIVELLDGMEAFLPGSQIDVRPVRDFDAYLEKRMEFKIVKLNPTNENIVVSHKALIEKDLMAQREKILLTMEPGQILEGIVKNITDFGVFIDLGGVDGLLHITDLSWGRVSHPSELVTLDQKLNVVVLDYDKDRQRISLGLKQLQKHPWEDIEAKVAGNQLVEGKVVSITDYGAFVELEKGIEGLVHISEMSWTEHIRHPSQMVSLGQIVQVKILNVDSEGKKISLGMKQLEPDPWENIAERYPPGTVMRGKVRNITNFGVFVEIEPGIDGLVHISDLSWTKRIRHPSDMVKKGQELDVVVLNIDTKDRRISLGHKQVETNPWNTFAQVYSEGSVTSAKVVRVEDKGMVVELPMEVEAFVPERELPAGTNLADFKEGAAIENLFVIRFDANQKEIVLSATEHARTQERAERQAEKREQTESRKQEAREIREFIEAESSTSGPTTLGELSGLAALNAQMEEQEAATPAKAKAKAKAKAEAEAEAEVVAEEKPKKATKAKAKADEDVAQKEAPTEADAAESEVKED